MRHGCISKRLWIKPVLADQDLSFWIFLEIVRNFNQVLIRIPEVDRENFPGRARSLRWRDFNGHTVAFQMIQHLVHRGMGDQAQVTRSRGGCECFGLKLMANLMKVDFLLPKLQGFTIALERDDFHTQDGLIKGTGAVKIRNSENEMV